MRVRAKDHNSHAITTFISLFKWARNNVENPGWLWVVGEATIGLNCLKGLRDNEGEGLTIYSG